MHLRLVESKVYGDLLLDGEKSFNSPSLHGVHVFLSVLTVPMQSLQATSTVLKFLPAAQAVHVVKSALTVPTQFLHLAGVVEESDQVLLVPQGPHDNLSLLTAPLQSLQAASTVLKYLYAAH